MRDIVPPKSIPIRAGGPPASIVPEGLVYVSDAVPGISRRRHGTGFVYRRPDGVRLDDAAHLQRIRRLAIPPAYTAVWISPLPHGHLQATGRDARGRKQYRYHAQWRETRDAHKFDRLLEFAAALPRIRRRVARDLAASTGPALAREAVLATIVRLLDTTLLRVGNEEYARSNGSFGLSTLRQRHAELKGSRLRLSFRGKSGVLRSVAVEDPAVARIVRRCQSLPGQELFHYVDEQGQTRTVGSSDVNDYLREASGGNFTAKDFRTWHGSVQALDLALTRRAGDEPTAGLSATEVLAAVASRLGNTVAVCRKSYVHPSVLALLSAGADAGTWVPLAVARHRPRLPASEGRFVAFLSASAGAAQPARQRSRR
jgi:DNA topoisomerase-1